MVGWLGFDIHYNFGCWCFCLLLWSLLFMRLCCNLWVLYLIGF